MPLQTRRPPGHARRKALAYAADILSLRAQGHSLSAIRDALEDAGVTVSISTVWREVLRGVPASQTGVAVSPMPVRSPPSVAQPSPYLDCESAAIEEPLQGKAVAKEFMRNRTTNSLYLREPGK